jgi:hypothetical protein
MKEEEYFHKASQDARYRREKIEELRYHKKFTFVVLIVSIATAAACSVYGGISEGKWGAGFSTGIGGMWGSLLLMGWVYANTKTRLAALEVMDGKQPESVSSATTGAVS